MSLISRKHTKSNSQRPRNAQARREYDLMDALVVEVANSIACGYSRLECVKALMEGNVYQSQKHTYDRAKAYDIVAVAFQRFNDISELKREDLRNMLIARYDALYENSFELGDYKTAKGVLDSVAKLFNLQQEQKQEVTIDNNTNQINIRFGLSNGPETE